MIDFNYIPTIKLKGFCPNPIARFGIPDYADSVVNPRVRDTLAYEEFWNEQIDRCINGYLTGGVFIPGRYYYYLNFCYISTPGRGTHFPDYVDLDLEFFNFIEDIKARNKGMICIKARRKGISEKVSNGVIDYGMRFSPEKYQAGICAGLERYVNSFKSKVSESNARRPPEFRIHYLADNKDELISGYELITTTGKMQDGSFNRAMFQTMYNNPNLFKGEFFEDLVYEEAGEFNKLIETFGASEACLMVGAKRVGIPYVYGTGGNIKNSSRDFLEMWHEHESFDLERLEIMGPRLVIGFFAGSRNEKGVIEENIPNVKSEFPENDETCLGIEDPLAAYQWILSERKKLLKNKNKKKYYDFLQNYPLNFKEAFLKFSGNPFNPDKLSEANQRLLMQENLWQEHKLDFVMDEVTGAPKMPLQVTCRAAREGDNPDELVKIRHMPNHEIKDLDVAGIDSYDLDESANSKSLGGMAVLRRNHSFPNMIRKNLCAIIRNRPKRKEIFYENCLKLSVFYGLKKRVLIDYANKLIIEFFKRNGGLIYLAPRPVSFESENSDQRHDYGVSINVHSKPLMIALIQTWVEDHIEECDFIEAVDELIDYDVTQRDSDWDLADAIGIALMEDVDLKRIPAPKDATERDERFVLSSLKGLKNTGVSREELEKITDPFLRMIAQGKV